MHELGIAQGILELVQEHVPEENGPLLRKVCVRVGSLSGVSPDALELGFAGVVSDTPWATARLEITRVPARFTCLACEASFEPERPVFACPSCASPRVRLEEGAELQVTELLLDDPPSEAP